MCLNSNRLKNADIDNEKAITPLFLNLLFSTIYVEIVITSPDEADE